MVEGVVVIIVLVGGRSNTFVPTGLCLKLQDRSTMSCRIKHSYWLGQFVHGVHVHVAYFPAKPGGGGVAVTIQTVLALLQTGWRRWNQGQVNQAKFSAFSQ